MIRRLSLGGWMYTRLLMRRWGCFPRYIIDSRSDLTRYWYSGIRYSSSYHRRYFAWRDSRENWIVQKLLPGLFPIFRPGSVFPNLPRAFEHVHYSIQRRYSICKSIRPSKSIVHLWSIVPLQRYSPPSKRQTPNQATQRLHLGHLRLDLLRPYRWYHRCLRSFDSEYRVWSR